MRQVFFACLLALTTAALADDLRAERNYGVKQNAEERIISLPQDQGRWFVTLFGDPRDARFQDLQRWFQNHTGLKHLRSQTHFNIYSTDNIRYRQRYAKTMPGLPCVRVQTNKGVVASEFWSDYIPMSPDALYAGIRGDLADKASWGCLRKRRCCPRPRPQPEPEPVPEPEPQPEPEPEPEPQPPELPTKPVSRFPWLLTILAGLIGGGIGFYQGWRDEVKVA
jgi:hypothetical protein